MVSVLSQRFCQLTLTLQRIETRLFDELFDELSGRALLTLHRQTFTQVKGDDREEETEAEPRHYL